MEGRNHSYDLQNGMIGPLPRNHQLECKVLPCSCSVLIVKGTAIFAIIRKEMNLCISYYFIL